MVDDVNQRDQHSFALEKTTVQFACSHGGAHLTTKLGAANNVIMYHFPNRPNAI
jgi:hypothetical protein